MRSLRLFALASSLATAACSAGLPEGAYYPDPLYQTSEPDAEIEVRQEAGVRPDTGQRDASLSDGSGSVEEQKLQSLAGLYLMRMDMLSSTTVTPIPGVTIKARSRISHLIATELYVANGQLHADEQLCHQTFAHVCTEGCETLSTRMHPNVTNLTTRFPRTYAVQGDTLSGDKMTMLMGYDGSQDSSLPASGSDPRVWDPVPSAPPREGMMATLELKGKFPVPDKNCSVYTVQRFGSSFQGKLKANSLIDATFTLTLESSPGNTKTIGSNDSDCSGEGGASDVSSATVRFAKTTRDAKSLFDCPEPSEWDVLPPPLP